MARDQRDQRPFHEQVADRFIELLEAGTAPWQRPWEVGQSGIAPINPTTGKRYRGINNLWLQAQGHSDPRWLTYRQAGELGAQVQRGEVGTTIQYWKFDETQTKKDDKGRPFLGVDGKPVRVQVPLERPQVFYARVFNAEQIEGLPPMQKPEFDWNPVERAEKLLVASGAKITHQGSRSFYRLGDDAITLPPQSSFPSSDRYYATALHELGHWSGHSTRLDRDMGHPFGSEAYAREELRAEIASMMLGDELGIGHDPGQHAAYVQSWIQTLRDDPMEIFRASADASKIQDYVVALGQKQDQSLTTAQEATQSTLIVAPNVQMASNQPPAPSGDDDVMEVRTDELLEIQYRYQGQPISHLEAGRGPRNWLVQDAAGVKFEIPEDKLEVTSVPLRENAPPRIRRQEHDYDAPSMSSLVQAISEETPHHVFTEYLSDRPGSSSPSLDWRYRGAEVRVVATDRAGSRAMIERFDMQSRRSVETVWAADIALHYDRTPPDLTFPVISLSSALQATRSMFGQTRRRDKVHTQARARKLLVGASGVDDWELEGELLLEINETHGELRRKGLLAEGVTIAPSGMGWLFHAVDKYGELRQPGHDNVFNAQREAGDRNLDKLDDFDIVQHSTKRAQPSDAIPKIFDVLIALGQRDGNLGLGDADSRVALSWFHGERAVRCMSVNDGSARIEYLDTRTTALAPAAEIMLRNGLAATGKQTFAGVPLSDALVLVKGVGPQQADKPIARSHAIPGLDAIAVAAHLTGTDLDLGDVSSRLAVGWTHRGQPVECVSTDGTTAQIISAGERIGVPATEVRLINRGIGATGKGVSIPDVLTMTAQSAALTESEKRSRMTKPTEATPKQYLSVPFREKQEAKELGARWDRQAKAWYAPATLDKALFAKWLGADSTEQPAQRSEPEQPQRQYLAVPYGERALAKSAGAQWDKLAKAWYVGKAAALEHLARWLPDNMPTVPETGMDPREEFAQALTEMGGVFTPKHPAPIMDGSKHRMKAQGDGNGEAAIFYVGHTDGAVPAGYIKNNRTGIEIRWKASGHRLSEDEKVQLRAQAAAQAQVREADTRAGHEASSTWAQQLVTNLSAPQAPTAYMLQKDIATHAGVLADEKGQTIVPFNDTSGKVWGVQYIQPDGTKRLSKNSRKQGCFHAVGGLQALAKAPAIVIAEGYASAATLAEMLGHPTVAAFDSGNLKAVAQELRAAFPDKAFVIAGDDDKHLESHPKVRMNVGRVKAQEAASATGATLLMPIFAPKEQAADPKGFTDFNDLANKSALGREGCRGQVLAVLEEALGLQRRRQHTQRQERSRPQSRSI